MNKLVAGAVGALGFVVLASAGCSGSGFEGSGGSGGAGGMASGGKASAGTNSGGSSSNAGSTSGGASSGGSTTAGSASGGLTSGGVTSGGAPLGGSNVGGFANGGRGGNPSGGSGGAMSGCNADGDCTNCQYPTAPQKEADCYCAICANTPMTKSECAANQAAFTKTCANVALPCPAIACIMPPPVACKSHECVAAN